jgi:hypothetical protein
MPAMRFARLTIVQHRALPVSRKLSERGPLNRFLSERCGPSWRRCVPAGDLTVGVMEGVTERVKAPLRS